MIFPDFPALLLDWYDQNARILPWREDPTPYHVWVSEIMLQQTRVEAVKPYYTRFLSALPDIRSLAEAPEEQLLKLWEGLGYYSRVRTLQKAAQTLISDYNGALPADYAALLSLPGFGPYTAGAVASIAFNLPVPAVDGNVLRVTARLTASFADITKPSVRTEVTEALQQILPTDRPGDFNQALMELGATVCLPNGAPRCDACPLSTICEGHQQGFAAALPQKAPKKPRRIEERTVFVLLSQEHAALHKRPDTGLLASLWEFPSVEGALTPDEATAFLTGMGLSIQKLSALKPAKHIFSHIEWVMTGYLVWLSEMDNRFIWADQEQLEGDYALPSAFRVYYTACKKALKKEQML